MRLREYAEELQILQFVHCCHGLSSHHFGKCFSAVFGSAAVQRQLQSNPSLKPYESLDFNVETVHGRLIFFLKLRIDFRHKLIIRFDISHFLEDCLQLEICTRVAAPGFPIGLGCPHQAIPVEGTVNVLDSFSVYRLGRLHVQHETSLSHSSFKLTCFDSHYLLWTQVLKYLCQRSRQYKLLK